jgi:hypothetical protein
MLSDLSWPSDDSPVGAVLYIAGTVVMTVWMRRADFKRGGSAAAVGTLDLLSSLALAIPALAYWNTQIGARLGDALLRLLFGVGVIGLLGFLAVDARAMLRNQRLTERQRRVFALIGAAAVLVPSSLELWWAGAALAHLKG